MTNDRVVRAQRYGNETVEVTHTRSHRPEESGGVFPPLEPGSEVHEGIRIDRDVAVTLRDGVTIYTDVYRPQNAEAVPAIVAWSPYGKRAGYVGANHALGVPADTFSAGTKFEGPDPEYWCPRGYAIINPDPRGVGNSEGDIVQWCTAEGRDTADLIEWVAEQSWCTGKVGMSGSSWLAISQLFAAAERPPHLACIAPWEGLSDFYRELAMRGGIPEVGFLGFLRHRLTGPNYFEDAVEMCRARPLYDAYWADKSAALERIEVPTYLTAGWSHFHLYGSLETYQRIGTDKKWMRAHREFEWPDYYCAENLRDLELFFERYLKGMRNGWELTPRVRLDVMDRGDRDAVTRRAEADFPPADTEYRTLHLDAATSTMGETNPETRADIVYDAQTGSVSFDHVFAEDTEITGYIGLRLWVEARGNDDADIFVALQKADEDGTFVPTLVLGQAHPGSPGMLRASHRELDESASTPSRPWHTHRREQKLSPGEIVPLDIAIWPTSRFWHAGERLRVSVSGHYIRDSWFEPFRWDLLNQGEHVLHTGGEHDSYLVIPVIPARRRVIPDAPFPQLTY